MSNYKSKFRHLYGDAGKPQDSYIVTTKVLRLGESQYVKANSRFLAYGDALGGKAPVYVRKLTNTGRPYCSYHISTHKGRLTDFDFHPFDETIIATASEDCKVNINQFPIEGLTENITKPQVEIKGHTKAVSLILFNPSANNIIASASYDVTVKILNIEKASIITSYDQFENLKHNQYNNIYSLAWNKDGSKLAITSKDNNNCLRIMDPRKPGDAIKIVNTFGGKKSTKCFFVDSFGWIGSTGFSKFRKRELKIWDERNIGNAIYTKVLDSNQKQSVLMPHVDNDLNMLYLAGKGDNIVRYYELRNDDKIACVYSLSLWRDSMCQHGGGWVPKRGLNVWKCEIQRFLKLKVERNKASIIPVSFIVCVKSKLL